MTEKYEWPRPPSESAVPIAKNGYQVIFAAAFVTLIFSLLELTALALIALAITFFICAFFRDPERVVPTEDRVVVSPADGRVVQAEIVTDNDYLGRDALKIGIFMNVFNVHVNRIPHEGVVKRVAYYPGKFINAGLDKASKENEHNAVVAQTPDGNEYAFVQVAGLVARRIISSLKPGDPITRGDRFGMICFGSRLDIYLPVNATPAVKVGDRVKAGTSIIGYFN